MGKKKLLKNRTRFKNVNKVKKVAKKVVKKATTKTGSTRFHVGFFVDQTLIAKIDAQWKTKNSKFKNRSEFLRNLTTENI